MDVLLFVAPVFVALAAFSLVLALAGGYRRDAVAERLEAYRWDRQREAGPQGVAVLRRRAYSGLPPLSALLAQFRSSEQVARQLEQAGVPLRVGEYYMIRFVMAVLFFTLPFLFQRGAMAVLFGLGLAVVGYFLPAVYIRSRKKARLSRINAQLVDMLSLVSNSLKSGYGLMQGFEFASQQMHPPLAQELRRMLREANLGLGIEEALNGLGERIDSPDMDMVLTAIAIQRNVGGNLAEVLDKVAFTMRERERIRGEIRTLTAQQRMTGVIIGGLPVGVGLLFFLINPDYMSVLFTETVGRLMLLLAVGLEAVGIVAMKRIMAIEV